MTAPRLRTTHLNPIAGGDPSGAPSGRPALVLGPSLGTGAVALWGPIAPLLAPHFELFAWDLPGHGGAAPSTEPFTLAELASAVVAAAGALREEGRIDPALPVHYAGVSIGGATGVQLGHDHPGFFSRISVICSAAKIGTPEAWTERAELVAQAGTPTMVVGSAQRWFAPGFIEANPVVSTNLLHTLQDADRFSYAHACGALAGYDLRDGLGAITDPLLAIAGAHDSVCPPADAEALAAGVADGRSAVVPSAAHLAPAEDPEATARLLIDFFTQEDPRG
ncbi:alpha/beta fold hydrolase [Zafaria sp. Z1313]|uniref:alpha/beta fold hydrolase n=1 Tax=Zafaria sp. Z1313 TaxID=3423202 RepID=UPI003D301D57